MSEDVAKKRLELIKAAEEKKIKRSVKFLTKCEDEDILRIYKENENKENEKVIEALCSVVLNRGSHLLEYFGFVPDRFALSNDLSQDELSKKMFGTYVLTSLLTFRVQGLQRVVLP